ncbi:DUF6924 domain-containing protein [Nocardia sp. NPDC004722]
MMASLLATPGVPVVRTDFSDQAAWQQVKAGIGWVTPDEFEADVTFVDDRTFAGVPVSEILQHMPDGSGHSLLLIVDETTIQSSEHPVLVVDLGSPAAPDLDWPGRPAGRSFRALPHTIQEIENNLSISNMDWEDFAEAVDDDGVLREHSLYGRIEDFAEDQIAD